MPRVAVLQRLSDVFLNFNSFTICLKNLDFSWRSWHPATTTPQKRTSRKTWFEWYLLGWSSIGSIINLPKLSRLWGTTHFTFHMIPSLDVPHLTKLSLFHLSSHWYSIIVKTDERLRWSRTDTLFPCNLQLSMTSGLYRLMQYLSQHASFGAALVTPSSVFRPNMKNISSMLRPNLFPTWSCHQPPNRHWHVGIAPFHNSLQHLQEGPGFRLSTWMSFRDNQECIWVSADGKYISHKIVFIMDKNHIAHQTLKTTAPASTSGTVAVGRSSTKASEPANIGHVTWGLNVPFHWKSLHTYWFKTYQYSSIVFPIILSIDMKHTMLLMCSQFEEKKYFLPSAHLWCQCHLAGQHEPPEPKLGKGWGQALNHEDPQESNQLICVLHV